MHLQRDSSISFRLPTLCFDPLGKRMSLGGGQLHCSQDDAEERDFVWATIYGN